MRHVNVVAALESLAPNEGVTLENGVFVHRSEDASYSVDRRWHNLSLDAAADRVKIQEWRFDHGVSANEE